MTLSYGRLAFHGNSQTAAEDNKQRPSAMQKPHGDPDQGRPSKFMPKRPATSVGGRKDSYWDGKAHDRLPMRWDSSGVMRGR